MFVNNRLCLTCGDYFTHKVTSTANQPEKNISLVDKFSERKFEYLYDIIPHSILESLVCNCELADIIRNKFQVHLSVTNKNYIVCKYSSYTWPTDENRLQGFGDHVDCTRNKPNA